MLLIEWIHLFNWQNELNEQREREEEKQPKKAKEEKKTSTRRLSVVILVNVMRTEHHIKSVVCVCMFMSVCECVPRKKELKREHFYLVRSKLTICRHQIFLVYTHTHIVWFSFFCLVGCSFFLLIFV